MAYANRLGTNKTYTVIDTLMALNDTLAYEGALIKLSSVIEVENYTNKSYPIIPITKSFSIKDITGYDVENKLSTKTKDSLKNNI